MAGFLPFSFFIAYGVMSIPAGALIEKQGEKKTIIYSFLVALVGTILITSFTTFGIALASLFLIGIGMAMLQVAINPLLRVSGGEENFAFYSVMAQLVFAGASAISPRVYSYLMEGIGGTGKKDVLVKTLSGLVPEGLSWVSLYWIFTAVIIVMILVVFVIRFPGVQLKSDEKAGAFDTYKELLKNKYVVLFFLGIFAYVGTEQGTANWISEFLKQQHGFSPQQEGAWTVSSFWLLLTIGCVFGLVLLKLFSSKKILVVFSSAAIISLTVALMSNGNISMYAFAGVGFFMSVMWSIIFSLALNSVAEHHGSFSGILCTGIIGGALVPLIIGTLGDLLGLKTGMFFLYITLGYILSIGIWAKPIITNKTIRLKKD